MRGFVLVLTVLLAGLHSEDVSAQVFTIHDLINARYCENSIQCLDSLAQDNGFSIAGEDSLRYNYTRYFISDLRLKTTSHPEIMANNFASFHRTRRLVLDAKFSTCKAKQFEDIIRELEDFQFELISKETDDDGHVTEHYASELVPYVTDCAVRTYTYKYGDMSWDYYECALTFSED